MKCGKPNLLDRGIALSFSWSIFQDCVWSSTAGKASLMDRPMSIAGWLTDVAELAKSFGHTGNRKPLRLPLR